MSKPTVAFIVDTVETGGAERIASELAKAVNPARYKKLLVVTRKCDTTRINGIEKFGVELMQLNRSSRYDLRAFRDLRHILGSVDIVHSHKDSSLVNALWWSPVSNRPILIGHLHTKISQLGTIRSQIARAACMSCDQILVVSALDLEEHVNAWNLDRGLFRVVHNGVDTSTYIPGDKIEARERLGISAHCYLVGSIGTVNPYKGYEHLIECAAITRQYSENKVRFLIAGHTPDLNYFQFLTKRAVSLGVSDIVTFLGHRRDVHEVLHALDLFIMPSVVECLPVALLEAMSSGVPVVASAVGGIPEILGDSQYGLLVSPQDPVALASAILTVQNNTMFSLAMSIAAQNRIRSSFSVEAMARRVEAIYDELLVKHQRTPRGKKN
ncbi:MAG: glycosyltransferase family 4 protein [Caldilineaceae bacterium]